MWSRRSIEAFLAVSLFAAMAGCAGTPDRAAQFGRTAPAPAHPVAGKPVAAGPPRIPAEAKAEFDGALALARAGNGVAAEGRLASLARRYPQFHTPLVDLGILYRRNGNLRAAAQAFQEALSRDPRSAQAWTELGVTQRLGGKFQDAEQSYARAIAANPAYAPAYRDRGVLRDLYLGEPGAALGDFEEYRKLTGEEKPVALWIAELEHRTGVKQTPAPKSPTAAGASIPSAAPVKAAHAPQPPARN